MQAIRWASFATLVGIVFHYALFYVAGVPLLTETIAEWIMARTPSRYAIYILAFFGAWAKPFAVTGGLATLGALLWLTRFRWWLGLPLAALALAALPYRHPAGLVAFFGPALVTLYATRNSTLPTARRHFLLASIMSLGTVAVALESYLRNEAFARLAVKPVPLFPFTPPVEKEPFAPPLVRKAVTPIAEFYGMSKNTIDPLIQPDTWRLKITIDGRLVRQFRYAELLSIPRQERYVTLRCISNTLQSNLMGTALWSGFRLDQLITRDQLPSHIVEVAVIGVDGHGDSFPIDYAFSDQTLLALGMNGQTLDRTHGFPVRLLTPKYYGFKNVKWIGEIRFVTRPYTGTWPQMGYTKEPVIHTCSFLDKAMKVEAGIAVGGISFAGVRGIRAVRIRIDNSTWIPAQLETPLSAFTWTRWRAVISVSTAAVIEVQAQDGQGNWQAQFESPLFPNGVDGPTVRRVSI